jgi:lipopolysaccharide transport system ATP-binding protein
MNRTVIQVENLSKQYRLGSIGTGSIKHDINRWWHQLRGKEDPYLKIGEENDRTKKGISEYVWALRDINFEVKQGEVLGIIGRNGAGKSTLLKILSRTTLPTEGLVKIKGKIASLLEVGTGFHPELTGRQNIFLNGAILGMTNAEIKSKFDEIVDFSGVEKYIDTPVKRYSSGMYVRLAFAVAAHLDPEILIVDEVLAVGDAEFQKKAIGRMHHVSHNEGRTVLFVSHNMPAIKSLCNSCMILNKGKVEFTGTTDEAVGKYLNIQTDNDLPAIIEQDVLSSKMDGVKEDHLPFLTLKRITIANDQGRPTTTFVSSDLIRIFFDFKINFVAPDFRIVISLVDEENTPLLNTQLSDSDVHENTLKPGTYTATCEFPPDLFGSNVYALTVHLVNVRKEHYMYNAIAKFRVTYENPKYIYAPFDKTFFRPNLKWELINSTQ